MHKYQNKPENDRGSSSNNVSVSKIEISMRRQEELGGGASPLIQKKSATTVDSMPKKEERKSSFSPSIFVRRYLPFMK
jgi:hypothetical protein